MQYFCLCEAVIGNCNNFMKSQTAVQAGVKKYFLKKRYKWRNMSAIFPTYIKITFIRMHIILSQSKYRPVDTFMVRGLTPFCAI